MKQFLKFTLASCLGLTLALVLLFFIGMIIAGVMVSSAEKSVQVKANTTLKLSFEEPIPEKTNNLEMNPYDFKKKYILGLSDILKTIDHAKNDKNIKGIFLDVSFLNTGISTASSVRNAINDFKESGKFVISYSDYYSEGAYYLGSVANEIYLHPQGGIDFNGIAYQIPFFKEMLDKLGVRMQVYFAGQYKSATEPYRLNEMSDQNRLQTKEYIVEIYDEILSEIAASRNMGKQDLMEMSSHFKIRNPEDANLSGLLDGLKYRDEVDGILRDKLGLEEDDKIRTVGLSDYFSSVKFDKNYKTKDKIAVVYAEGPIVYGKGQSGSTGSDEYLKIFQKIRKKDDVKAVVLRVNSPGGNALASDIIWRELTLLKEKGIPLIVSMGDYAASGGYYIACPADSIIAENTTLTGSIGVYKMIPIMEELMEDKLGIHWDTVGTGNHSMGISPFFKIAEEEDKWLQEDTDNFYETFLAKVAEGRNMERDEVHEIAQGRIWTGEKAVELGLVDKLGNLENALQTAAGMAGLESYRVSEYPVTKEPIQQLIEEFTQGNESSFTKSQLKEFYPIYQVFKEMKEMRGVQARLPFTINFN